MNAQGQRLATRQELDTELGTKADKNGVAQFMEQQNEQWGQVTTYLNDNVATKQQVADVEQMVEGTASQVQSIFDVFAQQTGGNISQLQAFYTNLTAWLTTAMPALAAAATREELNAVAEQGESRYVEVMGNLTDVLEYLVEQNGGLSDRITFVEGEVALFSDEGGVRAFLDLLNEIVGKLLDATGVVPRSLPLGKGN